MRRPEARLSSNSRTQLHTGVSLSESAAYRTEHRNALNLENAKTLYPLVFSGIRRPKYRAGFLNRVSQVRILPRALQGPPGCV
jgi:hypothetical protein